MSFFRWTEEHSVGLPKMDEHHQQIFSIANRLYEFESAKTAYSSIKTILNELVTCTESHFTQEERLMEQANYSGLAGQRIAHKAFMNNLYEYQHKVEENPDTAIFVAAEAAMVTTDWLKNHIMKVDKQYKGVLH